MKKALLSSLISSLTIATLLFVFTPTALAVTPFPTFEITHVKGNVVGPDDKPLKFAKVTGVCDGKTANGFTSVKGNYHLIFAGKETCEEGSVVTVTVTKDGLTLNGGGTIQLRRDGRFIDINLSTLNISGVASVPEFGWVTGAVAIVGATGLYFVTRRKFAYAKNSPQ